MEISKDQAQRLFEAAKKENVACELAHLQFPANRYLQPWEQGIQTTMYDLKRVLDEIEASNRPPEIRWCVQHRRSPANKSAKLCCAPGYTKCRIAVYRFEKWEE